MARPLSIAIVGAGIGGLPAAAALRRVGADVRVFEQAQGFAPVGAGIQLTSNATKALGRLGLGERLRASGFAPQTTYNREGDTGNVTNILRMGREIEERYGAPDLMLHRAVLHAALASLVPSACIEFGRKLAGVDRTRPGLTLRFADGSSTHADAVVGADGIPSVVREALFGAETPMFPGRVAYRTTYPASRLGALAIDERAKWWGPDRHVVHYYTTPGRDEVYFIAAVPEPDFVIESWSAKGDPAVLQAAFQGFHPQVRAILAAAPELRKWALVERNPLPSWGEGNMVLLGDACHPMPPYMTQGAATAIEDAVVLARCLEGVDPDGVAPAFRRYEASRKPPTSRIQLTNRQNTWMRFQTDSAWVYAYDAWEAPLAGAALGSP